MFEYSLPALRDTVPCPRFVGFVVGYPFRLCYFYNDGVITRFIRKEVYDDYQSPGYERIFLQTLGGSMLEERIIGFT